MPLSQSLLLDADFLRRLDGLSLLARRMFRGGVRGERRSPTLGRGVEFADYRSYHPGDDYRYIDWNIYSRLDRLFVKLFSEEEDINVHLFLDRSRSMGFPRDRAVDARPLLRGSGSREASAATGLTKLAYAARVAGAIGYVGLVNLDRVGAVGFDRRIVRLLPPRRGRHQTFHLFRFLEALTPDGPSDLGAAMQEYAHKTRRRGLLVVLSDLLMPERIEEGLKLARYHDFEPFVIHVLADDDLLPLDEGDVRLVDSETGHAVDVTVDGPALAAFARSREAYLTNLERFCLRHQIEYLRTTTSIPFEDLVLRYLRIGGLVG